MTRVVPITAPSLPANPAALRITPLPPRTALRADLPTIVGTLFLIGLMLFQLV